ncbi:MAG: UDP-3-O-acyl-N-acetylglucosamine deacetylase [Acidobacteria bacterium]|nr:UDP-3-O-acyl-N-acetylglucosamine deacetylase [Acidobacteriota bacterium]
MSVQWTLKQEVSALGVGLHSGRLIEMRLAPASPNTGVTFVRTDLNGQSVRAHIDHVDFKNLQLATVLKNGSCVVQTTEHLLSALYAKGIDNVIVYLNGAEVPIMDGSASPFLYLIEEAGIKRQAVARKELIIKKEIRFEKDGKWVVAKPAAAYRVTYEIEFDHPLIRHQKKTVTVTSSNYDSDVARARTFGFLNDVNALKKMGLIRGGSLENAIVLDSDGVLNEGLRSADEFVSHKILDLVGDFSLCGHRIRGAFHAHKAGHEIHAMFMRYLLQNQDAYEIVEHPVGAEGQVTGVARPAMAS